MFYFPVVGEPALNLADLFEVVVDTVPDRLALVAGEARLTYAELDERANRFAHHLLDRGVAPGDKVAIYSWNRAEWFEVMLGAYKARAVPVNVNYRYVADEARYILENSDSVAVVFERSFAPIIGKIRGGVPTLRHLVVLEDAATPPPTATPSPTRTRWVRRCPLATSRLAPPTTSTSSTRAAPRGHPKA